MTSNFSKLMRLWPKLVIEEQGMTEHMVMKKHITQERAGGRNRERQREDKRKKRRDPERNQNVRQRMLYRGIWLE